jgi:heme exporter protein C
MLPSLHPGQDGNPALNKNDVDVSMRIVFYPAIAGWTLLGVWIASLKVRLNKQTENKLVQQ